MRSTIYAGNPVPVVLKAGEIVTIITASGTSGTAAVPGEGVADSLSASSTKTYGAYTSDREVIVRLTAGSASIQVGKEGGVGFVGGDGSSVSGGGIPSTFTSRALVSGDNGNVLTVATNQTATVNTGLPSGFGCTFVGAGVISFAGTATVNDYRTTGAANPSCALIQIGADTYGVYGSKA